MVELDHVTEAFDKEQEVGDVCRGANEWSLQIDAVDGPDDNVVNVSHVVCDKNGGVSALWYILGRCCFYKKLSATYHIHCFGRSLEQRPWAVCPWIQSPHVVAAGQGKVDGIDEQTDSDGSRWSGSTGIAR